MAEKKILAVIDANHMLTGIGRAPRAAIILVKEGKVEKVEEVNVAWDEAHESEQEGVHHARIAKFLKQHGITEVIASGSGPDISRMIEKMGIKLKFANGDYKHNLDI